MEILTHPKEMQSKSLSLIRQNKSIGFVPTMGALHEGHQSLIRESNKNNDITIVSIFVNPKQFAPHEDLNKYPRPIEQDINKLKELQVDILFKPEVEDMYPNSFLTTVEVQGLTNKLCGLSRPDHFKGVTTICTKLFNIMIPTISYFGQKDYQQALIIKRLVEDLNIPMKVKIMPIVRDHQGLALSSRNQYLSEDMINEALKLNQALKLSKEWVKEGVLDPAELKIRISNFLLKSTHIIIDYIEICDPQNLEPLNYINNSLFIGLAIYIDKVRLIDNAIIEY